MPKYPVPKDAVQVPPVPCDFQVGDLVTFTNEYGVSFTGLTVVGFTPEIDSHLPDRFIYLDTSCWWFPKKADQLTLEHRAN